MLKNKNKRNTKVLASKKHKTHHRHHLHPHHTPLWEKVAALGILAFSFLVLTSTFLADYYPMTQQTRPSAEEAVMQKKPGLNPGFIENRGLAPKEIKFYTQIENGNFYLTDNGNLNYGFHNEKKLVLITEKFVNGKVSAINAETPKAKVNYMVGNHDPAISKNLQAYEKLNLGEVYKNIKVSLNSKGNNVEKLFTLSPGANPSDIKVLLDQTSLKVNSSGDLVVNSEKLNKEISFTAPYAYQVINGKNVTVEAKYKLINENTYGFELGKYDTTQSLIIDPLIKSTYLGGSSYDSASKILKDETNNKVYVIGTTTSSDLVNNTGDEYKGNLDIFIARLNGTTLALDDLTYYGSVWDDVVHDAVLDANEDLYITGYTDSTSFGGVNDLPNIGSGYDLTPSPNSNVFIAKFEGTSGGSILDLINFTFLSGDGYDIGRGIEVDSSYVYVVGTTGSYTQFAQSLPGGTQVFPSFASAWRRNREYTREMFLAKLPADLNSLTAVTFVGAQQTSLPPYDYQSVQLHAYDVVLDNSDDKIYVLGGVNDNPINFPSSNGYGGGGNFSYNNSAEGFIARFNNDNTLSTQETLRFLGGSAEDAPFTLKINETTGTLLVGGDTYSSDYPTTATPFDDCSTASGSNTLTFITKLAYPALTIDKSTCLTDLTDQGRFVEDSSGNIYSAGASQDSSLPTVGAYDTTVTGFNEGYVLKLNSDLTTKIAATFLGGNNVEGISDIYLDDDGILNLFGYTNSTAFPTSPGAYQSSNNGSYDTFISKMTSDLGANPTVTLVTPDSGTASGGTSVTITGTGFQSGATVDFGGAAATGVTFVDSTEITATTPAHAGGAVDVSVTNPDTSYGTLPNGYTFLSAPNAPVATATPGALKATIDWTTPANGGSAITGYVIQYELSSDALCDTQTFGDGDCLTETSGAGTNTKDITPLTAGVEYKFTVYAQNAIGTGAPSNEVTAIPTTPSAPDAPVLNPASPGNTQVYLSWSTPADGGSAITGYRIRHGESTTCTDAEAQNYAVSACDFTDVGVTNSTNITGLTNDTEYRFAVFAINAIGESPASNRRTATPAIPSNYPIELHVESVSSNGFNVGSGVTDGSGVGANAINSFGASGIGGDAFPLNTGNVPGARGYTFAGSAVTEYDTSLNMLDLSTGATSLSLSDDSASGTILLGGLANPTFQTTAFGRTNKYFEVCSNGIVYLTPTAASGSNCGSLYSPYDLNGFTAPNNASAIFGTWMDLYPPTSPGSIRYKLFENYSGNKDLLVVEFDNIGHINTAGAGGNTFQVHILEDEPAPPTEPNAPVLDAPSAGNSEVDLTWSTPSNGGSPITGYRIRHGESATCTNSEAQNYSVSDCDYTDVGVTNSANIPGLVNGTEYNFAVFAVNAVGASIASNVEPATPTAPTVPNAPVLNAPSAGDSEVGLSWSTPADGGSAITGYRIRHGESTTCTDSEAQNYSVSACDYTDVGVTNSTNITGLTNGTEYTFAVFAINAVGNSVASNRETATPTPVTKYPLEIHLSHVFTFSPATSGITNGNNDGGGNDINSFTDGFTDYLYTNFGDILDARGYSFSGATPTEHNVTYDWKALTGSAVTLSQPGSAMFDDDISSSIPLTFTTTAFGETNTYVQICANGLVYLESSAVNTGFCPYSNSSLSIFDFFGLGPNSAIAGIWKDLDPSDGGGVGTIKYEVFPDEVGTRDLFVVEFNNISPRSSGGAGGNTFQIHILEDAGGAPTVPDAPVLNAPSAGDSEVDLTWSTPADGGSAITGYRIRYGESTTCTNSEAENYSVSACSYTDVGVTNSANIPGLTNGTEYNFAVFAVNAVGASIASNVEPATPATVTKYPLEIHLSHVNTPAYPSSGITNGTPSSGDDINSFTTDGFTNNDPFMYTNSGDILDARGYSFSGSTPTEHNVAYSWKNLTGSAVTVSQSGSALGDDDTTTSIPLTFTNTAFGQANTYLQICANGLVYLKENSVDAVYCPYDNANLSSFDIDPFNNPVNISTDKVVAGIWKDLDPSDAGGTGTIKYEIFPDEVGTRDLFVVEFNNISRRSSGGAGGNTFQIHILEDESGAPTAPDAPTLNTATPGDQQVNLSWSAPVSDGGSAITGYRVLHGDSVTCTDAEAQDYNSAACDVTDLGVTTSTTITPLTNDTQYRFSVFAINAVGNSVASNRLTATPTVGVSGCSGVLGPNESCLSQEITCGASPSLSGTDNLIFAPDITIQSSSQNTNASDSGITISDFRSPSCPNGGNNVKLTVVVSENFCDDTGSANPNCDGVNDIALIGATDGDNEVETLQGESGSSLTFTQSSTSCPGCTNYSNSTTNGSATLTSTNSFTPNLPITLFSNETAFSGIATLANLNYQLNVPGNPPAGAFQATLTYTLDYSTPD